MIINDIYLLIIISKIWYLLYCVYYYYCEIYNNSICEIKYMYNLYVKIYIYWNLIKYII